MVGRRQRSCAAGEAIGLLLLFAAGFACGLGPTEEDRSRLQQVENRYGDRYRFRLASDDVYLEAYRTGKGEPTEQEARAIYRDFWFEDGEPRSDSRYVYLNLYDDEGDFLFQLYWDPERQELVRSSTSHY